MRITYLNTGPIIASMPPEVAAHVEPYLDLARELLAHPDSRFVDGPVELRFRIRLREDAGDFEISVPCGPLVEFVVVRQGPSQPHWLRCQQRFYGLRQLRLVPALGPEPCCPLDTPWTAGIFYEGFAHLEERALGLIAGLQFALARAFVEMTSGKPVTAD